MYICLHSAESSTIQIFKLLTNICFLGTRNW